MIFILFFTLHVYSNDAPLQKKIITRYSGFSFLNAEIAMVIPDELEKKVLYYGIYHRRLRARGSCKQPTIKGHLYDTGDLKMVQRKCYEQKFYYFHYKFHKDTINYYAHYQSVCVQDIY